MKNLNKGPIKRTEFRLLCDNDEICVSASYNTIRSLLEIQVMNVEGDEKF